MTLGYLEAAGQYFGVFNAFNFTEARELLEEGWCFFLWGFTTITGGMSFDVSPGFFVGPGRVLGMVTFCQLLLQLSGDLVWKITECIARVTLAE